MVFIRRTFLILVLMSLNVFAQTKSQTSEQTNKPQATKFDEYEKITQQDLKQRLKTFVRYAIDNDSASGVIIIYARNEKGFDLRENKIRKNWGRELCHWDCIRFTFVKANFVKRERTEFWVVPKGAEQPDPVN